MATPITGIATDFDNDLRHPCTPDIGADERTPYGGPAITTVTITKTADANTVAYGNQVGFVVKLTNTTASTAFGLTVSDNLPAAPGVTWTIDAGATDPGWSVVGAPPNQSLQYSPTTLAGNTMTQAHVISATTVATCGSTLNNTASFTISNGCPGSNSGMASASIMVTGTGGVTTVLSQNFESGIGSWTTVNNTTTTGTGNPADTAWTIRPNPYTSPNSTPVTFNSSGGSNFILSNADLGGSGTSVFTILQSPSFSTVGYTGLSISYRHYYRFLSATEAFVEVSTDGGTTWTPVRSYTATQGAPTAFVADSVNLDTYVGQATVSVRFRYQDGWSWYWAIDDIVVTGTAPTQPCPAPLTANSAVSRQTHGGTGDWDVNLPLSGSPGIECRNGGGSYLMIITFSNNVVSGNASVTSGTGVAGAPTFSANTMLIPLTGVTDVQQIEVTATNVTDANAQVLPSVPVPMIMLIGDSAGIGNATVNAGDVGFVKSLSGQTTGASNFRADIAINGTINAGDVGLVKSKSGNHVP
jgi:hypothetical protein